MAGVVRIELTTKVLETSILPLNYTPVDNIKILSISLFVNIQ